MHYFLLITLLAVSSSAQEDHPEANMDVDAEGGGGGEVISPPSISTISGVVTPGGGGGGKDEDVFGIVWNFLTAEWWRMAVAAVVLALLLCLACYLCRWAGKQQLSDRFCRKPFTESKSERSGSKHLGFQFINKFS
jgi:hypothetical protein